MARHSADTMRGKNTLEERAEEGVKNGELVSPLAFSGRKGGNPESPAPEVPEPFAPADPLGILPDDDEGRGHSQLGKVSNKGFGNI